MATLKGRRYATPEKIVSFPRPAGDGGENNSIYILVRAIRDFEEFNSLVPKPLPPVRKYTDGREEPILTDTNWLLAMAQRNNTRSHWIFIQSIKHTEGLEFDHVILNDPTTWDKWREDLFELGLNEIDMGRLFNEVQAINGMDEALIKAATEDFYTAGRKSRK